jgi:tetratricopeptide (TPR) repeat protein
LAEARAAGDPDSLGELARTALAAGEEEAALPMVQAAAERLRSALLWQWTGLLQRSLDEHGAALRSFEMAAELAPGDPSIAHGQARVALEAGVPSLDLFERAIALSPGDGAVLLGRAAARHEMGETVRAVDELQTILNGSPQWIAGHQQLAQLRAMLGEHHRMGESLAAALERSPRDATLWDAVFNLHLRAEDYGGLEQALARARLGGMSVPAAPFYAAVCAAELDVSVRPSVLFEDAPPALSSALAVWRIRHLLRGGDIIGASELVERELAGEQAAGVWPYATLVWRLTKDARAAWLFGDPRLVHVADLTPQLPPLDPLAAQLRALHVARGPYPDQSVRGGTQTDGPLLSRVDPHIRALRIAIVAEVERYRAALPPPDRGHPLLSQRRDRRVRFAGSWSVRLGDAGHHAPHVHPQGWISSALYVALPELAEGDDPHAGWLAFGDAPTELNLSLAPVRMLRARPGQLVLFPSWMWHGTRPFGRGERLTVAFDVRAPI